MKWLKESRNCGWAVSLCLLTVFTVTLRAQKMERRKEIVWPSERIVSRKDFVRNGGYTYIFEITRLILARHRLFLYGEKLGLSFPTFQ